jgi:hypothetical protein
MQALLWPIVVWILREVVVKFVVFAAVFGLVAFLVPYAVTYLGPFIGVGSLNSAFGAVSSAVWFFLDFFQLGYGVPVVISALVSRFLIRRLPVIG